MLLLAQLLPMHHIQQVSCSTISMNNGRIVLDPIHGGGTVGSTRPRAAHDGFLHFVQLHSHRCVSCSTMIPMSNGRMVLDPIHEGGTVGCTRPRAARDGFSCFAQLHSSRCMDDPNSNLGQ
jgi:hypothetical protein